MSTEPPSERPPPEEFDRDEITFPDGTEGRIYTHPSLDKPFPSVTTITEYRTDPEKEDAINGWKDRYDGSTQYRSPHWEDQLEYKTARGTLGHYGILSDLVDLDRTDEEDDAQTLLQEWGDYDGEDAWQRCLRDLSWATEQWNELSVSDGDGLGITPDTVIDAERYAVDYEHGYAGQFDLLYESPSTSETVLTDLKFASGTRESYYLQLAGYANAIPETVDRLQVIRLYPDDQEVDVSSSDDWARTIDGLTHEFLGLVDQAQASIERADGDLID